MEEDWRLAGNEYLQGKTIAKVRFVKFDEEVDHGHCSFCWAKFSNREEDLHVGFITEDLQDIICEECYNDFKDRFHWKVAKERPKDWE